MQNDVARSEIDEIVAGETRHAAMRNHDALWTPRRSGGVHHIGEIIAPRRLCEGSGALESHGIRLRVDQNSRRCPGRPLCR